MKFNGRRLILFAGIGLLGLTPGVVSAQVLEAVNDHYLIAAHYEKSKAYAGNSPARISVVR